MLIQIPILDDSKQPTTDLILGRPLLRVKAWINGGLVVTDGYGLVDTGSRRSSIHRSKVGDNTPENNVENVNSSGTGMSGTFGNASIQVEHFREIPVELSVFDGPHHFDVIIGRDILRFCDLVMSYTTRTFTIDMP